MGGCSSIQTSSAASGATTEEFLLGPGGPRLTKTKSLLVSPQSSTTTTRLKIGSPSNSQYLSISNQDMRREQQQPSSFGSVPTMAEAQDALSDLQRLFVPVASRFLGEGTPPDELQLNRANSAQQFHKPKFPQSQGISKVFETFHSVFFNPYVQRMVVSLSTDKAVWDAILKNQVVQEIQESFHAERTNPVDTQGSQDVGAMILRWILETTKAKIMEFIDKITKLVNEIFHSQEREKDMDNFYHLVRSSFMISIMVFMIIVVKRVS